MLKKGCIFHLPGPTPMAWPPDRHAAINICTVYIYILHIIYYIYTCTSNRSVKVAIVQTSNSAPFAEHVLPFCLVRQIQAWGTKDGISHSAHLVGGLVGALAACSPLVRLVEGWRYGSGPVVSADLVLKIEVDENM